MYHNGCAGVSDRESQKRHNPELSAQESKKKRYNPINKPAVPYNPAATITTSAHDVSASVPQRRRRRIRIYGRRYPLTITEHKYLEIGINVGFISCVEIAIGDKRGNEVLLSLGSWKGLLEHQDEIMDYYRSEDKNIKNPLYIGELAVHFTTFNNTKCIQLDLNNVRLLMMESTINYMFSLDKCIHHMFNWLITCIDDIDRKFRNFSNIAYNFNDSKDAVAAIESSEYFNSADLVDCELLALAF